MGRYFGREPRYSQEEAEAQAKQAIEAAASRGRPPDEEWKGLASRMAEINRELATRPTVEIPPPPAPRRGPESGGVRRRPVNEILRPRETPAENEPPVRPAARKAAAKPGASKRTTAKKRPQ